MTKLREHRIFGPPGCGKTFSLVRNLEVAAEKFGAQNVLLASFTKAASGELAQRVRGFSRDQIGTLHSHGNRAIGRPPLIDDAALESWNDENPGFALPTDLFDREATSELPFERRRGDETAEDIYRHYTLLRNRMTPRQIWPESAATFALAWEGWKREGGVIDFTDMVELALRETDTAPGAPLIGFFDETQDFTPLELALVRKWGAAMQQIVLAGDDDQMIYGFKGASVDAFLDESVEPASVTTLKQSFRVPRAVHATATQWIEQLGRRQPKPYLPRDEDGRAWAAWDISFNHGDAMVHLIEQRVAEGGTVMVLADAGRMLGGVLAALRSAGLPFANRHASRRGDWNPLRGGKGTSAADRIVALSRPDAATWGADARPWTPDEIHAWAEPLRAEGVFVRGGKAAAGRLDASYTLLGLAALFADAPGPGSAIDRLGSFDLAWYGNHLTAEFERQMRFPLAVAQKRGARALTTPPSVMIGTIHSAKGAESSTVILCPDLSHFSRQDWDGGGEAADNVRRLFYVGMTRAIRELIIAAPSERRSLDPHELLGIR